MRIKLSFLAFLLCLPIALNAAGQPSVRSSGTEQRDSAAARSAPEGSAPIRKSQPADNTARAAAPRQSTAVQARSAALPRAAAVPQGRAGMGAPSGAARSAVPAATGGGAARVSRNDVSVSRSATARSAAPLTTIMTSIAGSGRGGRGGPNVSRAATSATAARSTALFGDMSKMGGTYAQCREAYNTCMDQFCGQKSDEYRRCICSDKFMEFDETSERLSAARNMLQSFADTNLEAVQLSAAEVGAMYTATDGERAIKKDTSAAQKMLNSINDLLSGKGASITKTTPTKLDFSNLMNFSDAVDDIWSGGGSDFWSGGGGASNVQDLEGQALFNNVDKQCTDMAKSVCEAPATLQMVRSAYGILITQDCNTFEKRLNTQREQVVQRVREADRMLRAARLEEYREHNSASVNECIAKVRTDVMDPNACGPNWNRCLDFTGKFINPLDGEPIFSPILFQLSEQIELPPVGQPPAGVTATFVRELDKFRNRATVSLDSCRDDKELVWNEFKRQALIEIAQSQDRKLEEIKMSCMGTVQQCYANIGGQAGEFAKADIEGGIAGAMMGAATARLSRSLCAEKVGACASMFCPSDVEGGVCEKCTFDGDGNVRNPDKCGARALFGFVNASDNIKIMDGCRTALNTYLDTICMPDDSDQKDGKVFPYKCRNVAPGTVNGFCNPRTFENSSWTGGGTKPEWRNTLCGRIGMQAATYCTTNVGGGTLDYTGITATTGRDGANSEHLEIWMIIDEVVNRADAGKVECMNLDELTGKKGYAKWLGDTCVFTSDFYEERIKRMGGFCEDGVCYLD